ncbi:MAG: SRPBCC family protein [Deltaproteobacteria bacterium]|nr:SRPBCC family protein [Nannocystaceae bacterium]
MDSRSTVHATLVIERELDATPAEVFVAYADAAVRSQWDCPNDAWVAEYVQDFRVGGREHASFGPPGGPMHVSEGFFLDIVQDRRIITAGTMHAERTPTSVTLCTIELEPSGAGTKLVLTDQSAFLDGIESHEQRRSGWGKILDRLVKHLQRAN